MKEDFPEDYSSEEFGFYDLLRHRAEEELREKYGPPGTSDIITAFPVARQFMAAVLILLGILVALFLTTLPVAGQTAVDTVMVQVQGRLSTATITTIQRQVKQGDSIQFMAEAVDADGDPVVAVFTWATSDSTIVRIDPVSGWAVGLRKGFAAVSVLAEEVSELRVASFRNGELNFGQTFYREGDQAQYCAYLVGPEGNLVAQSPGPPTCPLALLPSRPLSPLFAVVPRVRDIIEWGAGLF